MSGGNDGNGSSWGSGFLKLAGAAAAAVSAAAAAASAAGVSSSDPEELTERWKKPEIGWVKVNVDGGRDHEEPSAGCGGVARDEHGDLLFGFCRKLDPNVNNAHETELEAILTGLELASKRNYEKVVVESDCEPALSMVKKGLIYKLKRREREVVECIRKLLFDPKWEVKLVYVDRSANRVANRLVKVARQLPSLQPVEFRTPPDDICNMLISEDKNNDNGSWEDKNTDNGNWGSGFWKVAGATAATAAVAAGVISLLSSPAAAEAPFTAHHDVPKNSSQMGRWKKPEIGWVKVNVDGGGLDSVGPSVACGGVVRDARGEWLLGFGRKLDPKYKSHEAELKAILTGLELAWKMNVKKVVVESDFEPALSMVNKGFEFKLTRDEREDVQCIRKLLFDSKWEVKLVFVDRSANRVANRLVKVAREFPSLQLIEFRTPPDDICNMLISEDNTGHVYASYF